MWHRRNFYIKKNPLRVEDFSLSISVAELVIRLGKYITMASKGNGFKVKAWNSQALNVFYSDAVAAFTYLKFSYILHTFVCRRYNRLSFILQLAQYLHICAKVFARLPHYLQFCFFPLVILKKCQVKHCSMNRIISVCELSIC